jgi:hypothetical protein
MLADLRWFDCDIDINTAIGLREHVECERFGSSVDECNGSVSIVDTQNRKNGSKDLITHHLKYMKNSSDIVIKAIGLS